MASKDDVVRAVRPLSSAVLTVYTLVLGGLLIAGGNPGGESGFEWLYLIPVLSATSMGLFLSVRRPENAIGTLTSLTGAALVSNGFLSMLVPRAVASGSDIEAVLPVLTGDLAWTVQFLCALVLLPLWFPTGRAINERWAWVGRVAIIFSTLSMISFAFADSVCVAYLSTDSSVCTETLPIPWSNDAIPDLEFLILGSMVMAVPAILSVFVRLRRSRGVERMQLKWVLLAVSLVAVGIVLSFDNWGVPQSINDVVNALTLAGLWVAIAVAIVRYRLYDIDRIISRTLSYAVVIGLLAAVFFGLVALSTTVLPSNDPLVVAVSTLAVAALFNPVRRRVRRVVDRRFNRTRYNAELVLDEFASSLRDQADAERIIDGWIDVVHQVVHPSGAAVWLKR